MAISKYKEMMDDDDVALGVKAGDSPPLKAAHEGGHWARKVRWTLGTGCVASRSMESANSVATSSPVRTEIRPLLGERREFPKIRRVSTKSELSWRPQRRRGREARRRSRGDGKSGRRGARGRRRDPLRAVAARLSEKSLHGRHDWVRSSILGDLQREIYTARIVGTKSPNASSQLFQRRRTTP